MNHSLTIQIPTYRNIHQLCDTLNSLIGYTEFPFFVRVINNDEQSEKQVEDLVGQYPSKKVEVIHAGSNRGWMGAHNMVLDKCDTPFVCLLNDDVFFLPGQSWFWHNLLRWFKDPAVGAVGPISNFVMGAQNMWVPGVKSISETTLLIGFCVVMRTGVLKSIGGLDETLPGGDDLDWSIRIRDAGYKLLIDKASFLYHIGQQTGKRVKPGYWDSLLHQERTNNALIKKHGVKRWYETLQAGHWPYGPPAEEIFNEKGWYAFHAAQEKKLKHKGLNLGCGHMQVEGVPGLDLARMGETGAGGRKWDGAMPNLTADATRIPVGDDSLDFLMAAHIFEHIIDPVATLKEWGRALKSNGVLYATMPNHSQVQTMTIDYTHVHAFTPESARNLFESLGWTVEYCEGFKNSIAFGLVARRPQ